MPVKLQISTKGVQQHYLEILKMSNNFGLGKASKHCRRLCQTFFTSLRMILHTILARHNSAEAILERLLGNEIDALYSQ